MASSLIFLTGSTGFIGGTTALSALKAGYRLRLALRKESQIAAISSIFSAYSSQIEFVIVPDITSEAAYAGKLDGCDYVLHHASPLVGSLVAKEIFEPAVNGTIAILKEASRVASVKRVVITSSVAALQPLSGVPEGGVISGTFLFIPF
jgi:nucleoside-diphosphate-sugar epimerase